jgi:type IV pilus assembly protein PilE
VAVQTRRMAGFTLIELMIVVAVVAVLAGIAVPQYGDHVLRGQLSSGTANLKEVRSRMEQRYADNRSYAAPASAACAVGAFTHPDSGFSYTCALNNGGQGFVFTATGTGRTAGFTYTIDEAGVESTTATKSGWTSATLPVNRFIIRKGG